MATFTQNFVEQYVILRAESNTYRVEGEACVKQIPHLFPLLLQSSVSITAEISILILYSCL